MEDIIQLKIKLKWSKPPIWRRILVSKKTTFNDLHHIIQICMGWENYHLYEFRVHNYRIGPDEGVGFYDSNSLIDSTDITLEQVLLESEKTNFIYEYDFGDGWIHEIKVEKFLKKDSLSLYPICTKGKLCCPPEDCGGIGGFYHMLDVIKDKLNPEREEYFEWLGEKFDAEYFDTKEVNEILTTISFK